MSLINGRTCANGMSIQRMSEKNAYRPNRKSATRDEKRHGVKDEPAAVMDCDQPLDFSNHRDEESHDASDFIERKISRDSGISVSHNVMRGRGSHSPERRQCSRSPSLCSLSGDSDRLGETPTPVLQGSMPTALFPGFPAFFPHGLHAGLSGGLPTGQGLWPMAAVNQMTVNQMTVAALMYDQRMNAAVATAAGVATTNSAGKLSGSNNGHGSSRPFKQFPSEQLNLPLGYYALPGFLPAALQGAADSAAVAQAMKNQSEELLNLCRQHSVELPPDKKRRKEPSAVVGSRGRQSNLSTLADAAMSSGATSNAADAPVSSITDSLKERLLPGNAPPPTCDSASAPPPATTTVLDSAAHVAGSSSASSSCSSVSSDGESFGASPSSGIAAATPTSTTGRSSVPPSSRKRMLRTLPTEHKDDAYWERRRKNNEAAKRSRDARRAKEDEIAIRAAFLEQENLRLRVELAAARQEMDKLRAALMAQQASSKSSEPPS